MNLRAPETFVRINIPHAAQEPLIEQQRFDPRAAGSRLLDEFLNVNFERIGAKCVQLFHKGRGLQVSETPESPRIRVAQLTIVIEQETGVGMLFARLGRGIRRDLPGHSEMHEQRGGGSITVGNRGRGVVHRRKPQQHELSVTIDSFDLPARKVLLERYRVIDEIRFPKPHGHDSPPNNRTAEAARHCLDFRKFRHEGITSKIAYPLAG